MLTTPLLLLLPLALFTLTRDLLGVLTMRASPLRHFLDVVNWCEHIAQLPSALPVVCSLACVGRAALMGVLYLNFTRIPGHEAAIANAAKVQ